MERPRRLHPCLWLALAASLVLLACPNDPPPVVLTVATPTFSAGAGIYTEAQTVYLSCATVGAEIRYTTDGSDPTEDTGTLYTPAGVLVDTHLVLKALAYKDGMNHSAAFAEYWIDPLLTKVPTPDFDWGGVSLPSGIFTSSLTDVDPYCELGNPSFVYTTDGSDPAYDPLGAGSTIWTGGHLPTVSKKTTLKLMAYRTGMIDSDIKEVFYDVFGSFSDIAIASLSIYYGGYNAMAVDAAGKYHVAWIYNFGADRRVKYSTNASGSWVTEDALTSATGWEWLAIAVSSLGDVHIAGYKNIGNDLLYITKPHSTVEVPDPVWAAPAAIDNSANVVGQYVSMAIDSADKLHAAYYNANLTDLKYATNATGSWVSTVIDSDGVNDVGTYCSLGLDSSDYVHISYYDATNDNLKYITNTSGGWVDAALDQTGDVGMWSSIAVDTADDVHISYYDAGTNMDLKYATNASGGWVTTTVDSTGITGLHTSIAVDADDSVRICYFTENSARLWYAIKVKPADSTWLTKEMRSGLPSSPVYYAHVVTDGNGYAGILSGVTFTKDGP